MKTAGAGMNQQGKSTLCSHKKVIRLKKNQRRNSTLQATSGNSQSSRNMNRASQSNAANAFTINEDERENAGNV